MWKRKTAKVQGIVKRVRRADWWSHRGIGDVDNRVQCMGDMLVHINVSGNLRHAEPVGLPGSSWE